MSAGRARRVALPWLLVPALAVTACRRQSESPAPGPSAERGRALYERGIGSSGEPVVATVGANAFPASAAELPCAGCHGPDGRGKPEGGTAPSDIRWDALTRPYEVEEGSGRRHPPYDQRLFSRAVAMGIDSAGQPLDGAMPRYQLARAEAEDLIAYLRTLGDRGDPGVDDREIRIGAAAPHAGAAAEGGRAALAALEAYFQDLNRRGGLYGRRLSLRAVELPEPPEARAEAVRKFLETERPFALVGVALGDGDDAVTRLLEAQRVPVVGALSLRPPFGPPRARYVFYLYGGLVEQARALAATAVAARPANHRVAVLHSPGDGARDEVRRVSAACTRAGLGPVEEHGVEEGTAAALVASLARKGPGVIVFLGPPGGVRWLRKEAVRAGWAPLLLVPGMLLDEGPAGPGGSARLLLAAPVSPADRLPEAMAGYRQLAETYRLPGDHLPAQLSAIASAELLIEGLKRAGRSLTREGLVGALEGLRELRTGLTPPISFGKDRRIGALGAYVYELDASGERTTPVTGWVPLSGDEP